MTSPRVKSPSVWSAFGSPVERSSSPRTWCPSQATPGRPAEGIARADYRRAKFGEQRSGELDARVAAEAAGEGLEFALERQARTPNTFAAHQLIDLAQERGVGEAVVEALFRAYFEHARDTGNRDVLKEIALECAVPTFIFGRRLAVSGAHPPEALAAAIREAAASA